MPTEIKQQLRDFEILFGTSENSGWKRECQKSKLLDILIDEGVYVNGLRFKCTKGSRFGIHQHNTIAAIHYHDKVVKCLEEAKTQQTQWQAKRLERSLNDNTTKWETNRLFMGVFTLLWIGIGRRLLSIENVDLTVTEKKSIAMETIERFKEIINGENKFEILRRFCIMATKNGCENLAIIELESWLNVANDELQSRINDYLLAASKNALWKIEKDSETLLQLLDSDERIQTSNRFYFITLIFLLIF